MFSSSTEKVYNRQVSAPILKRKSSRFGLGQFLSSSSNANTSNVASTTGQSHHLQISNAPQHTIHSQLPMSSSSGTTPTTPNIFTEKPYQFNSGQQQSTNAALGGTSGAAGRC